MTMPTHSIYSVRDKRKVDAEVIDVREVSGAKGVRYQIVGRHPEDGTTVTTFCSESVAQDFRDQLANLPHGLSAEGVEVDHIPEPEAPVVSTDGTPIDDDLDTFVEDPLVGSVTAGTITSAKVLAAEGELSKTSCCCGATEDDPCACMTADEPMQCSSTEPKCACYAAKGAEGVSKAAESKFKGTKTGNIGVTINGDWAGPGDPGEKMAIDIKLDRYQYHMMKDMDGLKDSDAGEWFTDIVKEGRKPKEVIDEWIAGWAGDDWRKELDEGTSGFDAETVAGIDVQTPSQIAVETPDSDELVVPDPDLLVNGDGRVLGQQTGAVNTTPLHAEDDYYECSQCHTHWEDEDEADGCCTSCVNCGLRAHGEHEKAKKCCPCDCEPGDCECDESGDCCQDYLDDFDAEGGRDFNNPDARTFTPGEALVYLRSGDNCVWLIDYSDHNYGDEEYPHYDYPIEDPDELETMIEEGVFEKDSPFYGTVIANDTSYALGMWKDQPGGKHPSYVEFDAEPAFARNKRVLVPTAVIGGLALAYLAKPELLSGSFDRISDLLGKLTKRKEE